MSLDSTRLTSLTDLASSRGLLSIIRSIINHPPSLTQRYPLQLMPCAPHTCIEGGSDQKSHLLEHLHCTCTTPAAGQKGKGKGNKRRQPSEHSPRQANRARRLQIHRVARRRSPSAAFPIVTLHRRLSTSTACTLFVCSSMHRRVSRAANANGQRPPSSATADHQLGTWSRVRHAERQTIENDKTQRAADARRAGMRGAARRPDALLHGDQAQGWRGVAGMP
ncbi:hypothetical protein IWX90DRAFT_80005 [Phyllosticta citrichinensis]|uniref:Uncharacterized protein n=1 Tax=Phyllosticta citrichinensis TaxID=1130410 RepID=A0ABR1XFT5_9PEZI